MGAGKMGNEPTAGERASGLPGTALGPGWVIMPVEDFVGCVATNPPGALIFP